MTTAWPVYFLIYFQPRNYIRKRRSPNISMLGAWLDVTKNVPR